VPPADDDGPIARLLIVKALPLFADVAADELAVIAEHMRSATFGTGEVVFGGPEQPVDAIHLIVDGRITEHRFGRPFRSYGPLRVIGGIDALARSGTEVQGIADEETRTLFIDRAALRDILEDSFGILSAALQGVAAATLRLRHVLSAAGFDTAHGIPDAPTFVDSLPARMNALRSDTWLGRAGVRTLGQLARESTLLATGGGTRLWGNGDTAEHAVVLLRGTVTCVAGDRAAFRVGRGTVLGLDEALALEPRWHDATTAGETTLLSIGRATLIDALEDDTDTAVTVLAAMAGVASHLRDLVAEGAAA
jgi:CRP-like cAMP-binding protein